MDLKQLNDEFRKLEKEAGEDSTSALLQIIDYKMNDFKSHIDAKFDSLQSQNKLILWVVGLGMGLMSILITILKLI